MSRYDDILDRLRKATGPDRLLDAEIACAAAWEPAGQPDSRFNTRVTREVDSSEGAVRAFVAQGTVWKRDAPTYTVSIDAALELVEKMLPRGKGWAETEPPSSGWRIGFERGTLAHSDMQSWTAWVRQHGCDPYEAEAPTASLAILIALLTALQAQEGAHHG